MTKQTETKTCAQCGKRHETVETRHNVSLDGVQIKHVLLCYDCDKKAKETVQ